MKHRNKLKNYTAHLEKKGKNISKFEENRSLRVGVTGATKKQKFSTFGIRSSGSARRQLDGGQNPQGLRTVHNFRNMVFLAFFRFLEEEAMSY